MNTQAPQLRDYQLECVESIWNEIFQSPTSLAVLPTGSGKTFIISLLMKRAMEVMTSIKIGMLMGRVDLVTQSEQALSRMLSRRLIGVYCGSLQRKELSRPITVASIQSIADIDAPHFNLLIVDEVHNLDQNDGRYFKFIEKAQSKNPKLKIVGFTATPFRANGIIHGEDMLFKRIAYRKTVKEMIALGYLCEPKMRGSAHAFDVSKLRIRAGEYRAEDVDALVGDKLIIHEQVTDALSLLKDRHCVVWACANIEHCNLVAEEIGRTEGPFSVTTIHSQLNRSTRDANLAQFRSGSVRHMVFVTVLSEGFDHPPIDCVVLMRPTRSPVLYVQTVGRGLRPHVSKKDCLVLDYGQVVRNLGPLDDPIVKGKPSEKDSDGQAPVKECPKCHTFVFAGILTCPECEHQFPPLPSPLSKLDKKAQNDSQILSQAPEPEKIVVNFIFAEMYRSAKGNECVKLTYSESEGSPIWGGRFGVREFFVIDSPWATDRLDRRLEEIDMNIPEIPFSGEISIRGMFEVIKIKDGKWDRVMRVRKLSDETIEDTSFDFGANQKGETDGLAQSNENF